MKKALIMLGLALLAAGCGNKEIAIQGLDSPRRLTVDIKVNHDGPETRAVKTGWGNGDKIYVFFDLDETTTDAEYMTMTYDGEKWSYALSNGTMEARILEKTSGKLYAVSFPYGTPGFSIGDSDSRHTVSFSFGGDTGSFFRTNCLSCLDAGYTVDADGRLSAELNMAIGSKDIQFFIPGITEADNYFFSCNRMDPAIPSSIGCKDGVYVVSSSVGKCGSRSKGYAYQGGIVFTGQLDPNACGNDVYYSFTLIDTNGTETESDDISYYFVNLDNVTLDYHDAVKLPSLDSWRWSSTTGYASGHAYVDMGNGMKWATMNVGAARPEDAGDYFAWGEKDPKPEYTLENYVGLDFVDTATANWGSGWRMPTIEEWITLKSTCTWRTEYDRDDEGMWFAGYQVIADNGNRIFIPVTGFHQVDGSFNAANHGCYWSSTFELFDTGGGARHIDFDWSDVWTNGHAAVQGMAVRPVLD